KRARTWTRLEEAFNKSEIVTGVITGRVKGGFTVEIENVRAFLPGSLVDVRPVRDTSYLEGKPLEFKVIKLDQKRNNVVVSRRAGRACSARSPTSPTSARSSRSRTASRVWCTCPRWTGPTTT